MTTSSSGAKTLIGVAISARSSFPGGDDFRRGGADAVYVGVRHCGVQRQRHGFAGDAVGVRNLPFVATVFSSQRAQVKRFVRHSGADAPSLERIAELFAVDRKAI